MLYPQFNCGLKLEPSRSVILVVSLVALHMGTFFKNISEQIGHALYYSLFIALPAIFPIFQQKIR